MPINGWRATRFFAIYNVDFELSTTSASKSVKGRKRDMLDFFPTPRIRKLRRP